MARRDDIQDKDRGVYMISVAAELSGMHPQTLRIYEMRGLISPKRSPKNTRLYSHKDVELLRRIQALTTELGLNLAGVERVLALEQEATRLRRRVAALEAEIDTARAWFESELERTRREAKKELVLYRPQATAPVPLQTWRGGRS